MKKKSTRKYCVMQSATESVTHPVMQTSKQLHPLWRISKLLMMLMIMINISAKAQVRPAVNTLSAVDQAQLATDIHTFLDAPGHAHVFKHLKTGIHDQIPFLPWHRYYIGLMEDDFINTGKSNFVPLPKWNPSTAIPNDFFTGANSVVLSYPALVNQTIANADLVFTPTICNSPTRAILTNGDGGVYTGINHTIHDNGHVRIGGAMGNLTTAAGASIFYLWHGYIDDLWNQWECNCSNPADSLEHIYGVDLFMKDRNEDSQPTITDGLDIGYEPFTTTARLDQSEDIWVRNQDDGKYNEGLNASTTNPGITTYQNPVFGQTNYIYVRVRNRSCTASTGNEMVTVNWAKKSTALSWPSSFNGTGAAPSPCTAGLVMGNYVTPITGVTIPAIVPGGQTIVKIAWSPPNPADYTSCGIDTADAWNFCLLARILATNDPMAFVEGTDVLANVKNNNNIIMRNSSAPLDTTDCNNQENVEVGNYNNYADYYSIHYAVPYQEYENPITDYADVNVYLGPEVYQIWTQGGYQGYGVTPDTTRPYSINITSSDAYISNLYFQPNERYIIQTNLTYSNQYNDTGGNYFNYDIYQTYDSDNSYSGGVTYEIYKPECPETYAGNNAPVTCDTSYINYNAAPIPGATYNWYDNATGQYISSGSSLAVQPTGYSTYQLEVTSCNGCVDYSYVSATTINNQYPPAYAQNTYYNKVLSWSPPSYGYAAGYDLYIAPTTDPYFMTYTPPYATVYDTAVDYTTIGVLTPNTTYYWYAANAGQPVNNCTAYQFTTGSTYGCDPPLFYGIGPDTTIVCPALPVFSNPYSNSVCGIQSITYNDVTTNYCGSNYSVRRTWTATDSLNNSSYASQTINVVDNYAPVINQLPAETTISCHFAPVFATATAYDECGTVTLTYTDEEEHNFCDSHTAIREWTASDGCNTSKAYQRIFIDHTVAPFITSAQNMSVQSNGTGNTQQLNDWLASNGGSDLEGDCDEGAHFWTNNFNGLIPNGNGSFATVTFSVRHVCSEATTTTATFIIYGGPCDNVSIDDGNACTVDACDPQTGIVTHTPINPDDGNPCTIDGCDPIFGVFHFPTQITVTCTVTPVTCNGGNDGSIFASVTGGAFPYSFSWSNGATTPFNTGLSAGTYQVTVTDANGCTGSATYVVTEPTSIIILDSIISVSCYGGNDGYLSFAATGGVAPYAYSVERISPVTCCVSNDCGINPDFTCSNCSCTSSAASPYYNLAAATYIITATDAGGCSASHTVVITQPAPLALGAINGTATLCASGAQSLSYSVAAVPGVSSYLWSAPPGAAIISGQGTTSITVSITSSAVMSGVKGNLSVIATSSCGSSLPSLVFCDINATKPVTPNSISGIAKVCPGDVLTYSVAVVARATSYSWTLPSGMTILSGAGSNIISVAVGSGYAGGILSVSAANACGVSPLRSKALSVNTPNTPGTISGPLSGQCGATGIAYSIAPVSNATSYQWTITTGTNLGVNGGTSMYFDWRLFDSLTTVSVAALNGCGSSLPRTLTVIGRPTTPGVISGPVNVCANGTYNYSVATVVGTTFYDWTMPVTATIVSGAGSKNITVAYGSTITGSQVIKVRTTNACGSSSIRSLNNITVSGCPRIGETVGPLAAEVYPNPAHDQLNVLFAPAENDHYSLQLLDITGRIAFTEQGTGSGEEVHRVIDVQSLAIGMYLVQIITNQGTSQMKVVLE